MINANARVVRTCNLMTRLRFLRWEDSDASETMDPLVEEARQLDNSIEDLRQQIRDYEDELSRLPYNEYLRTGHWQVVRECALEAAGRRCQICNSSDLLQVHHRSYEFRSIEGPYDLTVLCAGCHKLFHDHRRLSS